MLEGLFMLVISIMFCLSFIVLGVIVPYIFLKDLFVQEGIGFIFVAVIILLVWFIVTLIIKIKNRIIIKKNQVKDIYIRDIDVNYSPAVLSYLINNKIETSKDLPATLLNLCAKSVLKIENVDNEIKIIDLDNRKEVKKLKEDEKYAYEMFVNGVSNAEINVWKTKVLNEYKKYKFSVSNKKMLVMYLFCMYAVIFVICCSSTVENEITASIMSRLLIGSFIATVEATLFTDFKDLLYEIGIANKKNDFRDIYTSAGAREYSKWKKFENFIQEFSLMKERDHNNIVIWGKYLSYSIALGINKKCDRELYNKIEKEYLFNLDLLSQEFNYED